MCILRSLVLRSDSKLALALQLKKKTTQMGRWVWLTRGQLVAKYGDETLADDIIERKRSTGGDCVAKHPEADEDIFYCLAPSCHASAPVQA